MIDYVAEPKKRPMLIASGWTSMCSRCCRPCNRLRFHDQGYLEMMFLDQPAGRTSDHRPGVDLYLRAKAYRARSSHVEGEFTTT